MNEPGFQLVEGDEQLFKLAYQFRFATIDHLAALTKRHPTSLHRRILKLVERGYLDRLTPPGFKHLYLVGAEALPILVAQGVAPDEELAKRRRHQELKPLFLKHELMVADIHAALRLASQHSHIALISWKQGHELHDTVEFSERGQLQRLPVRPDAFFTLADSTRPADRNRINFFLEADRSSEGHPKFQQKLIAYHRWFEAQGHTAKHGIKTFRVATVTLTPERAANLCQMARATLPPATHRFFLFSTRNHFSLESPEAILSPIFATPKDPDTLQPLVPMAQ